MAQINFQLMPFKTFSGARIIRNSHESLAAFANAVDETPARNARPNESIERTREAEEWTGGVSFKQALDLARYGWKEGREMMTDALALAKAATTPLEVPTLRHDVAGAEPDVARFLAGDPLCMIDERPDAAKVKPVIRVVVSFWTWASVPAQNITNQGAAILAQVDAWEAAGWECEIIADGSTRWNLRSRAAALPDVPSAGDQILSTEVVIKRAGEPLDIDAAAFALVHPAMLRRLGFSVCNSYDAAQTNSAGKGAPTDCPVELRRDYRPCVFVPVISGGTCSTPERAAAYVGAMFERAIEASRDAA